MIRRFSAVAFALLFVVCCFGSAFADTMSRPSDNHSNGWVLKSQVSNNLLVISTAAINGSILRALDEMGVSYDFYSGTNWDQLDLGPYTEIIVGMDGGEMAAGAVARLALWANGPAHHLHFYGGSCWYEYALALNNYLLVNDVQNYCWQTVQWQPNVWVVNASNYLAFHLPANYTFVDNYATFYQTRSWDQNVNIAALNANEVPMLMWKMLGNGSFDICINSPYEGYYTNDADYQWLKQVVSNMLHLNPTATEARSWGSVKAMFR